MSTHNRVSKGVPTGGQFSAGAKSESGISLGGTPNPAYVTPVSRPQTPTAPTSAFWNGLGRIVSFGLDKTPATNRAEKTSRASQGGAIVGSAAMTGGVVLGAPAVAAAAGAVLVVSGVALLASTIANRGKK